ncbi:KIR protein [Plasmodium coatneyi]|uniref:KIR protein n=1 Tax=Plasmodium coatneyi TaxID=208452 RepID=A0A1B1E265_9APIC|nr:KIR protein [Plasmodium coatneyi]ANQ08967.1 KIR protein [Plasmodium coatneyi]
MSGGKDPCLTQLPSQKIYDELDKGQTCPTGAQGQCSNEQTIEQVKGPLEVYTSAESYAEDIANAWYYACKKEGGKPPDDKPCYFFYYWLGSKITGILNSEYNFGRTMAAIYKKLGQEGGQCNNICKDLYDDISQSVFILRKEIFDYYYNYNVLQGKKESNEFLCSNECATYLEGVNKAYSNISSSCGGDGKSDPYCNEFTQGYKNYFKDRELILPCNRTTGAEPAVESEDEGTISGDEEEEDLPEDFLEDNEEEGLKDLPSRKKYKELDKKANSDNNGNCSSKVKEELGKNNINGNVKNRIMGAFCHIYTMESGRRKREGWWDYFYYWVGRMLSKNRDDTYFQAAMKGCKGGMDDSQSKHDCDFLRAPEERKVFEASKITFDYYKDKDTIMDEVRPQGGQCPKEYNTYLEKVQLAYKIMRAKCRGGNSYEWCKHFKDQYPEYTKKKTLKLKCKLEPRVKHKRREEPSSLAKQPSLISSDPPGSSTIPAISGTLGTTIGAALVSFFLYKYTSLFRGIGNTSSRSNRKKRSTTHNSDVFTEDDSSTEFSSELNSTLASTYESTEYSTEYDNTQSTRTGRAANNNNRKNGQHRNNIRYQRM